MITNPTQLRILKVLVHSEKLPFANLNQQAMPEMSSDNFNFHIKTLVRKGFIVKSKNLYEISDKGLEFESRIDLKSGRVHKQPKSSIAVAIFDSPKLNRVLLTKRLYQPLKGTWGIHTEKLRFGESIETAIQRCLKNEAGITKFEFEFAGLVHLIRKEEETILADVIHLMYKAYPKDLNEIIMKTKNEENMWVKSEGVKNIKPTTPAFLKDFDSLINNEITYFEVTESGRI